MARAGQVWHHEDIKAALRKRYGTLAAMSRMLGYTSRHVANTLLQQGHSVKTEQAIAKALRVEAWKLWPDRWGTDGVPLPRTWGKRTGFESQKKEAA